MPPPPPSNFLPLQPMRGRDPSCEFTLVIDGAYAAAADAKEEEAADADAAQLRKNDDDPNLE